MSQTSLAVLPFINRSSDEESQYFSDGVSEEIINALTGIEELKVISRTSSFFFKDSQLPLKDIASQLQVENILEGSVRSSGKKVRITAQLVDVKEDSPYWSASWDRELNDIFEVQDEIALLIAEKLREHIGHFVIQDHLIPKQTESIDAYSLALKGKYYFNQWNPESVFKGIELLEAALEIDPLHVESHLGLADALGFIATTGFGPREESWKGAAHHVQKALSLNPNSASAYYQLANIDFFVDCDFGKAYRHIQKALELNPNLPTALQFTCFLHLLKDELQQAEVYLNRALEVNPLSPETQFYKGYFLYRKNDFDAAIHQFDALITDNPYNLPALVTKAYVLIRTGQASELQKVMDLLPPEIVIEDEKIGLEFQASLLNKESEKSHQLLAELEKRAENNTSFQADSYLYLAYANSGMANEALDLMEKAMEKKSSILLLHFTDPLADPIKSNPRFQSLHQKIYQIEAQTLRPNRKSKKELLDDKSQTELSHSLARLMEEEKPYLNPSVSLKSVAAEIQVHSNQLSWLINKEHQKNFNSYINDFRIDYFKQLVKENAKEQYSLIGLAYESGFNSKTVFNSYFRKTQGITPGEYAKNPS